MLQTSQDNSFHSEPETGQPAVPTQQPAGFAAQNQKNRKPNRKGLFITIAVLLAIVLLVQNFAYPFLIQKVTFNKLSTLRVRIMKPNMDSGSAQGVTANETKRVAAYTSSIIRAYSWQLSGHEKNIYQISKKYLMNAPAFKEMGTFREKPDLFATDPVFPSGIAGTAVVSDITARIAAGLVNGASLSHLPLTADATTGEGSSGDYSKEQIASDISGIAVILQKAGYVKLATVLQALAAESSPVDPLILNNLAGALREQGMKEDAYKLLNYAWRMNPSSPDILTNMGNVCLDMGDKEQAGTWFDMALAQDEDFGLAHEGLMLCYMLDKRYEVAMRHMIKASETVFTSALSKTYDYLSNLDNYDDIRDNVLNGFTLADLQKTYQRTRETSIEGIDTPANQIKIPKFPTYTSVENFISGIGGMHSYAMSIFTPAMGSLSDVLDMAKQAEELIKSFESSGISGVMGAVDKLGLLKGDSADPGSGFQDGKLQLPVDYSREQFTVSLLSDYVEMKSKKPIEKMMEQFEKSQDPIMQATDRGMRDFESRGESEEAWLGAMANNWGNSMSFSDSTVSQNKVNINQHIDALYQAILPAYNELKPLLEEYWLYTGGIIKYCGNETVFKSLDSQRKMMVYGKLANFAIIGEVEAIYVPLTYSMLAIQGAEPPKEEPPEEVETLEKPKDEEPAAEDTYNLDLGVAEIEWSGGELEIEATALLAGSAKFNFGQGTVTLAGGVGLGAPDVLPVGGKVSATYYVCFNKTGILDHGLATKTEYSVGEIVQYKVKTTNRISSVTSAMDTTVEKAIVAGKIYTQGKKKTTQE